MKLLAMAHTLALTVATTYASTGAAQQQSNSCFDIYDSPPPRTRFFL